MTVELPIPLSRAELYLAKAAGMAGITVPSPESREECYLAYMAGVDPVDVPAPASLKEKWLYLICGGIVKPLPAIEGAMLIGQQMVDTNYLAAAAGLAGAVTPASPRNRAEEYFVEIAQHGPFARLKTVSGVSLVLNDVNHGIESLNYFYGDTTQQTYSGKNLLNLADSSNHGINGIVNSDGTVTISGEADSTGGYRVFNSLNRNFTAGTYTMTISKSLPFLINFTITSGVAFRLPAGQTRATTTLAQDYTDIGNLFMSMTSGVTYNETFKIQLVAGSTPDYDFEPYVGGIPAPNPDYPQNVNVVTGRQVVNIEPSLQLVTKDGMATPSTDTSFWASFTNLTQTPLENGWATLSRDITSGYSNFQTSKSSVKISGDETYTAIVEIKNCTLSSGTIVFTQPTASQDPVSSYSIVTGCDHAVYDGMGVKASGGSTPQYNVYVFTSKSIFTRGLRYFVSQYAGTGSFDIRATVLAGDHSSDWQEYCGDNWKQYNQSEYEVNLGKNLFDKATATVLSGAINSDLTYTSGGDARTVFIPCKPNTKYSASKITQGSRTRLGSCTGRIDTDGGSLTNYSQTYTDVDSRRIVELTTGPNDKYLYFTFGQTSDTATIQSLVDSIQIEVGNATSYAPYFTPIELCKIGEYQDYIYKSGDDWYLHKATVTLNPNGAENWKTTGTKPEGYFYTYTTYYDNVVAPRKWDNLASNYFTLYKPAQGNKWLYPTASFDGAVFSNCDGSSTACLRIMFPDTVASSVGDVGHWFENNSAKFYYPLATPTDTQITNQALIDQLDALDSAVLPSPDANVLVTGDIAGAIDFTYYATP